jgi:hypothetical protein
MAFWRKIKRNLIMANTPYLLPVEDTIRSSWGKVKGSKASFWAALAISILISIGFGLITGVLSNISEFLSNLVGLIGQFINTLISMGILRAKNAPINFKQMFYAFNKSLAIKVILLYLLQMLIFLPLVLIFIFVPMMVFGTAIGDTLSSGFSLGNFMLASWIVLGILVGIYLMLRLLLSMGFILDKGVGPWSAIKMSFTASKNNELRLFAIVAFQILAIIIGAIPFGIGLIWVFTCQRG